ncbi:unnamed protein product, partial [Ectocarpus sp. 12 AP-2014]
VTGVTGAGAHLLTGVEKLIRRVRRATRKPLSVGFGISSTEQVLAVARIAGGVVVGSAFINAIDEAYRMRIEGERKAVLPGGNIGAFGGCYIPETLVEARRYSPLCLQALEEAYTAAMADPVFPRRAGPVPAGVHRRSDALAPRQEPQWGDRGSSDLAQEGGDGTHRRARNQQRHGASTAREARR